MPHNEERTSQEEPVGASTIFDGRYLAPPVDKDGKQWVRASALVQSTPEDLYALWRNVSASSLWREQVVNVREMGGNVYRWTMRVNDKTVEWDSEILADEPGKRIAWRSIGGDLDEAGEVVFEPAVGNRGTMVTVLQEFRMGKLESLWQTITGRNPKQSVIESLRHFKALAETGEIPRTEGQPHGPRGMVAKMKASMYGEHIPTPPVALKQAS